ncbi:hypothetical protein KY389_14355 [Paracoccus bogoriensis]|uniref:hypothetical protein n=1 Tax=Paracoccus bogoriensis TaxID=242065 RepID=UPI001CA54F26|nr:hypothetical protein [Paracoccus bogoriensis]MBW7057843.1 hypothetical protein [Paracoccus bogoriensis]
MTDIPVRSDISPEVHPGALARYSEVLNVEGTSGPSAFSLATGVLTEIYTSVGAVNDAVQAFEESGAGRQRRLVGGKVTEVTLPSDELITAVEARFNRSAKAVDTGIAWLRATAKSLEGTIAEMWDAPTNKTAHANEVRAFASRQDSALDFVRSRIEADDRSTVAAILLAPPFLSGLTDEQAKLLKRMAEERWCPVERRQADAVAAMTEHAIRASASLTAAYTKVLAQRDNPKVVASRKIRELAG